MNEPQVLHQMTRIPAGTGIGRETGARGASLMCDCIGLLRELDLKSDISKLFPVTICPDLGFGELPDLL